MAELLNDVGVLIGRHCPSARPDTAIAGLSLFRAVARGHQVNTIYQPTLCVVAQGRKQVALGDRLFEYDANNYMIVTVDLPVSGCIVEASERSPYLALSLDLDPLCIADLMLTIGPGTIAQEAQRLALSVSPLADELLDPVLRLLRLLDCPADAAVMAPLIRREIHYRLLQGQQGGLLRQAATTGSHLSQIGQAAAWIRSHYAEPVNVETLAQQAGMSATSFHRHFKAITLMSPFQYRTQIRLQEARRLMLVSPQDAGKIGFDVGYHSPSQFSRDYRKLFGLPPAADAVRLRRAEDASTLAG